MGEVRVAVRLINETDEKLVNRGLLNPSLLRDYETQALVDTGATRTVIPVEVVQQLGLRITGQQIAKYANAREEIVEITGFVTIQIEGGKTTENALVAGDEVLIGQTVLQALDLLVDCKNQCLISNRKTS